MEEKNLLTLIGVTKKSLGEKPCLKNSKQTLQNGFYVEMKTIADKERSHQSKLEKKAKP